MNTQVLITHRTTETLPDGGPAHPTVFGEKPPLRDAARSSVPSPGQVVSRDWRAATWALLLVVCAMLIWLLLRHRRGLATGVA